MLKCCLVFCFMGKTFLPCVLLYGKDISVKVTAIYVTLPLVAVAALLHFPVAWLIQRLYRRTSFSEALDEYRKQINCKPFTGPDSTHPRNQGLEVLTLRGLWKHFESFFLTKKDFEDLFLLLKGFGFEHGLLTHIYSHSLFHLVQIWMDRQNMFVFVQVCKGL